MTDRPDIDALAGLLEHQKELYPQWYGFHDKVAELIAWARSQPDLDGPLFPGKQRTSQAAAEKHEPRAGTWRQKVLDKFRSHGSMTDSELMALFPDLTEKQRCNSVRPRRVELAQKGWLEDTGRTRKNSGGNDEIVWALTK